MARYQEDAQSNTKDNRASPLHTIVSPKRLFASLQHLLALHGCLLIEITLAHTILLVLVSSPHPASQESAERNFTKTLLAHWCNTCYINRQGVPHGETTQSQHPRKAPRPSCRLCSLSWRGRLGPSPLGESLEAQCPDACVPLPPARRTDAPPTDRITRTRGRSPPGLVPARGEASH